MNRGLFVPLALLFLIFYFLKQTDTLHLRTLLSSPANIAILTHWSPDGDAMGSSLGMYNYLIQLGHSVQVITPNDYPSFLHWLPGNDKVIDFSQASDAALDAIQRSSILFTLDFNSLQRIGMLGEAVQQSSAVKILIDHHQQPEAYPDYSLWDTAASSTCELVYRFMEMMDHKSLLNAAVANCLYTGIMTDTGSFRFPSTSAQTHRIIADLIAAGAENAAIHSRISEDNTESRLKLLGYCLSEKMKILAEYNTAVISLSEAEQKQFNYKKGDTEGTVNYPLSIAAVRFSAFFTERDGIIKISFRSKGDFDVNQFARNHFSGGGHKNAAGGSSNESLDTTIQRFIHLLPEYKAALIK
jgi:bifunctional oligoribonuclease and PAP phosphatase NrnA